VDMHHVIGEALDMARKLLTAGQPWEALPRFPNKEP